MAMRTTLALCPGYDLPMCPQTLARSHGPKRMDKRMVGLGTPKAALPTTGMLPLRAHIGSVSAATMPGQVVAFTLEQFETPNSYCAYRLCQRWTPTHPYSPAGFPCSSSSAACRSTTCGTRTDSKPSRWASASSLAPSSEHPAARCPRSITDTGDPQSLNAQPHADCTSETWQIYCMCLGRLCTNCRVDGAIARAQECFK